MTPPPAFEAYALRFAHRDGMKSGHFFHYGTYCEPDESLPLDYYFWLLRNDQHTVLVDCGFHAERAAERKNRHQDKQPVDLLAELGVAPEDIDHVVISHMHYDHVGNLDAFPWATFHISRPEFDFWNGPLASREVLAWTVDPEDIEQVQRLQAAGRLRIVDDAAQIVPGINVSVLAGHTPGQLITEVNGTASTLVIASDALHFYEEMHKDRPFSFFHDIEKLYESYVALRALDERDGTTVVAGHDPSVMSQFERVNDYCVDLNRPVLPST